MTTKRPRIMAAESEKQLEDFYLDTDSFLRNDFADEDDQVGEPESSSDGNSGGENSEHDSVGSSEEDTEECFQSKNESIDAH